MDDRDPRDVPGTTAFHEDVEQAAYDSYLDELASAQEHWDDFFDAITGRSR